MNAEIFGTCRTAWKSALAGTLLVTFLTLAFLTAAALVWPFCDLPRHRTAETAMKLIFSGAAAAVSEEIFFRGWLQPVFRRKMTALQAITAVNLIFAPLHLIAVFNPISLAVFFPGMIMGFLKERYGCVWPPMLFHFIGNVWAVWFFPSPF